MAKYALAQVTTHQSRSGRANVFLKAEIKLCEVSVSLSGTPTQEMKREAWL